MSEEYLTRKLVGPDDGRMILAYGKRGGGLRALLIEIRSNLISHPLSNPPSNMPLKDWWRRAGKPLVSPIASSMHYLYDSIIFYSHTQCRSEMH